MSSSERDEHFMRRCLELARRAEGRTAPNPIVGCVIVGEDGQVLAEAWHERAGHPHAEALALALVGGKAPGATLYVNLEPCNHKTARRTAPCAPLVAAAGLARVVIGAIDPIRAHSGGARWLAAQGLAVTHAVLASECAAANRPFFTWAKFRRPRFLVKAATTLDGKIAAVGGESQWITGEAARQHAHHLRDRNDAVLVGIGTVLADDPQLTVRGIEGGRNPVRIVLDGQLRTPAKARLLPKNGSAERTIIIASRGAPAARRKRLERAGAEIWSVPAKRGRLDLTAIAGRLGSEGLTSVLVEGGGQVIASFVDAGLADELCLYVAPMAIGGAAPSWLGGKGAKTLAQASKWAWQGEPVRVGADLAVRLVRAQTGGKPTG